MLVGKLFREISLRIPTYFNITEIGNNIMKEKSLGVFVGTDSLYIRGSVGR